MRIAWLIPVRDGGALLARAVASALGACDPDDEVLVIDDGSVDGAALALAAHPQLRVLRQPPLGIVAALEHGRAATTAPLLARLDADDEALPGRIAAQRAALLPGAVVVGGQGLLEEGGEGMLRYVRWLNGLDDLHAALLIESPCALAQRPRRSARRLADRVAPAPPGGVDAGERGGGGGGLPFRGLPRGL